MKATRAAGAKIPCVRPRAIVRCGAKRSAPTRSTASGRSPDNDDGAAKYVAFLNTFPPGAVVYFVGIPTAFSRARCGASHAARLAAVVVSWQFKRDMSMEYPPYFPRSQFPVPQVGPAYRSGLLPVFLLLLAWLLPACTTSKPTLVVLVGGAGLSQLGELGENISALCPDADVIEAGGWDGFRADLQRVVRDHPCEGLILVGHSFGCQTIADAAAGISAVDLAVMIDPAWDDITLPRSVVSCLWYQRADPGLERMALIRNGGRPVTIAGDHNNICHSPRLIADVSQVARDISAHNARRHLLRSMLAPPR